MLKKLLAIRMKQKISIPTVNLIVPYLLFAFFVFFSSENSINDIPHRNFFAECFNSTYCKGSNRKQWNARIVFFPCIYSWIINLTQQTAWLPLVGSLQKFIYCVIFIILGVVQWNWNYIFLQLVLEYKCFSYLLMKCWHKEVLGYSTIKTWQWGFALN